jgi:hypothetical protein
MSTVDLKILRLQIKNSINREQTADILSLSGYEVGRDWKFTLREDERTPSASIRQDGYITDFGGDFSGDIVALLHEKRGSSLREATLYVCEQLNINTGSESVGEYRPLPVKRKHQYLTDLTDERYKQIVSEVGNFDRTDKQTFGDDGYRQSALSIAPMWVYSQTEKTNLGLFREFTTYDEAERSIVLKIRNYTGKLISYKHRYKQLNGKCVKWCSAPETHPNKQCMVSVPSHKDSHFPIYVVEGARDFLVMVLMGMNVVAIPTVNYREWTQTELSIFTGENIVLIPDLDDSNMNGVECMRNLGRQIDNVAKSVSVIDIRKVLDLMETEHTETKIDFSDVVNLWHQRIKAIGIKEKPRQTMEAFKSTLLYVSDMGSMFKEEIF